MIHLLQETLICYSLIDSLLLNLAGDFLADDSLSMLLFFIVFAISILPPRQASTGCICFGSKLYLSSQDSNF